jgi:hypothetical protein
VQSHATIIISLAYHWFTDSPEVVKEKKRPRVVIPISDIVNYNSSPILSNNDEDMPFASQNNSSSAAPTPIAPSPSPSPSSPATMSVGVHSSSPTMPSAQVSHPKEIHCLQGPIKSRRAGPSVPPTTVAPAQPRQVAKIKPGKFPTKIHRRGASSSANIESFMDRMKRAGSTTPLENHTSDNAASQSSPDSLQPAAGKCILWYTRTLADLLNI